MTNRENYFFLPYTCEIDGIIENYVVNFKDFFNEEKDIHRLYAFQDLRVLIPDPAVSIWTFMSRTEIEELMELTNNNDIRKRVDHVISDDRPKGVPRDIFVSLMYNVIKFCKKTAYTTIESAVVLSTFYLTHLYFTSKSTMSPEKLYSYFKDLLLCHCLPFPPNSMKILANNHTATIMRIFCKLYLRNLPLIRMLTLPNFALYLYYGPEEEIEETEQVKGKDKSKDSKKGNVSERESKKSSKKGGKKKGK